jgi:nucleoid-associated protein YgaU
MKASRAIIVGIFFLSGCGGCQKEESVPPAKPAAPAQEPAKAQPAAATAAPQAAAPAAAAPGAAEPGADDGDCIVIADANPDFGPPPLAVTFSAEAECSSGTPTYKWDFGDGSAPSTEVNPSHTYPKLGDYVATVVVTSPRGSTSSDEIDITVEEDE